MDSTPSRADAAGHAALAICESLLLAMVDLKIISPKDSRDLLSDAATSHREAASVSQSPEMLNAVTLIIERILASKNSVKHV